MIPNANLTNHTIINVTAMDRRKLEIKVGISYESDIKKRRTSCAASLRRSRIFSRRNSSFS